MDKHKILPLYKEPAKRSSTNTEYSVLLLNLIHKIYNKYFKILTYLNEMKIYSSSCI